MTDKSFATYFVQQGSSQTLRLQSDNHYVIKEIWGAHGYRQLLNTYAVAGPFEDKADAETKLAEIKATNQS